MLAVAAIALCCGATSCKKDKTEGGEQSKAAEITLYSPDDLEEFDLDYDKQDKALLFEWVSDSENAEYSILFSLSEDMSDAQEIKVGTETAREVTHLEFDNIMDALGVDEYKRGTLYWMIQGVNDGASSTSEIRSMELFRFYKPFIDPRDGEEYRVCRFIDPYTDDYYVWMADNIRAAKYSDGVELTAEDVRFWGENPDDVGEESLKDIYGGYYTWTAAVRGETGAEEGQKIQGICPEGWHVATQSEWAFMVNSTPDPTKPDYSLKNPEYWVASASPSDNSTGFNMAAAGYIAGPITDNAVIEAGEHTYFWTATAPKEGDEFPWDPNPADFPYQGVSYHFDEVDYGAALYPYWRTNGFSVRCVLD